MVATGSVEPAYEPSATEEAAMVREVLTGYLALANGLTEVTRQRAAAAARALAAQGEATAGQVSGLAEEILETSKANRAALVSLVRYEIDRALGRIGLASADELTTLQRRIGELERTIRRLRADADRAEVAPPAAAPAEVTGDGPPVTPAGSPSAAAPAAVQKAAKAAKKAPATAVAESPAKRSPAKAAKKAPATAVAESPAKRSPAKAKEAPATAVAESPAKRSSAKAKKAPAAKGPTKNAARGPAKRSPAKKVAATTAGPPAKTGTP